ncbi:MAG TPA: hypothetical protein VEL74_05460, partial [Thermoanaerobaculia bacterium]|nr:hypothetical protein [Thermoanaerobaculia bacterium]
RLARRLGRRGKAPAGEEGGAAEPRQVPLLVASLGPGYLFAGALVAVLYLVARLVEPLLASSLELSPGLSAWQFLFLGYRPELAWYLPLDRFPFLAGLLTVFLWLTLWWLAGMGLRLAAGGTLGRNLADHRTDEAVLPAWRRWAGAPFLASPVASYLEWAGWLLAVAAPLLIWAWLSLGGDPYRVRPSEVAVALVLWTSWTLHLLLRGIDQKPDAAPEEAPAEKVEAAGWPEVLARLEQELGMAPPEPLALLPVEPLGRSEVDPRVAALLSPLVAALLPGARQLTPMQRVVLTRLALQGYVHTDPPVALDELRLGQSVRDAVEDKSGQRSRNTIVLAPEGAGKTLLALLAAANHALVHTRATLLVVRGEGEAEALAERFRQTLEPSTLRWNVRVRLLGGDLMNDLAQGILPDVMVASLRDLVVMVLDRSDTFAPFLRTVGLVLVDDVESFAGPVEVHAQLAFRRLTLRLRELTGVRELGEESAPQVLVLGCESMHRMADWVRSLCGIDAVVRNFHHSAREAKAREAAELAAGGIATASKEEGVAEETGEPAAEALQKVRHQRLYRLRDFTGATGEPLSAAALVAVCERLAVPWHYRLCGDGRRDLGRGPLRLEEEPVHGTASAEEACVVLLDGEWSEVRREIQRLRRAGARFRRWRGAGAPSGETVEAEPEPIALLTCTDPDLDEALGAAASGPVASRELAELPRPVIRPPTGLAVEPHLSADLVQHWIEVEDLLQVFGSSLASRLRDLARGGLLLCERRTDVDERANRYVERVHVRALARAVRSEDGDGPGGSSAPLPPKVVQVEFAVRETVALRDRTNLTELGETGAGSAHLLYYPGRVFQDARGIFVVVGRASESGGRGEPAGDVLVEPLLLDEVSAPRRVHLIEELAPENAPPELAEAAGGSFPPADLVLLGRYPLRVALLPVEVRVEHLATYRLDPVRRQVRQRTLLQNETRERYRRLVLPTVALAILPNPAEAAGQEGEESHRGPVLTLAGARLVAAAMRVLMPSLYRGGAAGLQVALRLDDPLHAEADQPLGPGEGFYLFDADEGGNGMARALHRDGVEVLLRLCRRLLDRVASYDHLRALHDEWASEAEILEESRTDPRFGGESPEALERRRARDEQARDVALAWLDSRLSPEAGAGGGAR